MSSVPAKTSKQLHERSGNWCEGCGMRPATEKHHRLYKSRGGNHALENLLHLCGWGNHTGCHGVAHSGVKGDLLGWAIHMGGDPLLVPVMYRGVKSFLLADGEVQPVTDLERECSDG